MKVSIVTYYIGVIMAAIGGFLVGLGLHE